MEHTGIEAILNGHDPAEKRLALRSKAIEPFHLRLALQDEDPDVRGFVAHHPRLTPPLILEIINGDDRWLASHVLKRPDIRPEELEQALKHDDLHLQVLRHPAATPEIKNKLLQMDIPEGVRKEIEAQELSKNVGHLLFPGLGVSKPRQKGVFYPGHNKDPYLESGTGAYVDYNARDSSHLSESKRVMRIRGKMPAPGNIPNSLLDEHLPPLVNPTQQQMMEGVEKFKTKKPLLTALSQNKTAHANEHHEIQHSIFGEVAQKYGLETRDRLIQHVFKKIGPIHRMVIDTIFSSNGRPSLDQLSKEARQEEKLAYLHNYLMDPYYREVVHGNLGMYRGKDKQRELQNQAKEAWKELQRVSQLVTEKDIKVLGKKVRAKKEKVTFTDPKDLFKGENFQDSIRDHLGFDGRQEDLLEVARLLTGKDVDYQVFRARLVETDDEIEALQQAAGLEPDSRAAIENLLKLKGLKKSQIDMKVVPLTHNSIEIAQNIQYAAAHGQIESVKLSGKHSAGTLLARDQDNVVWLLKPGSGNQSPAAGAVDDPASQSRREAAFYSVSRMLGILDVPEAYLLQINGKEVACIKMLGSTYFGLHRLRGNDPGIARRVLKDALETGLLFQWSAMDYILGNTDRHGNNLIVGPEQDVALIDHGAAFAGVHFDPGHDSKSFVPYYLRVWGPDKGWSKMDASQRLAIMPTLNSELDEQFKEWVLGINVQQIAKLIAEFGIDPSPSIARLKHLQSVVEGSESGSKASNAIWLS